MKVTILPPRVHYPPDECMRIALECFADMQRGYFGCEPLVWEWLFRWVGAPV